MMENGLTEKITFFHLKLKLKNKQIIDYGEIVIRWLF